jgi:hypothetical protein
MLAFATADPPGQFTDVGGLRLMLLLALLCWIALGGTGYLLFA